MEIIKRKVKKLIYKVNNRIKKVTGVSWRDADASKLAGEAEEYPVQPYTIPLPSYLLREASSIGDLGAFYAIGEAWAHITAKFLPPNPTVLDLGCACGKLARFLYLIPNLKYIGIDLFLPAINWCQKNFSKVTGDRFTFEHFDGISEVYNPTGTIKTRDYKLPVGDGTIDMVVCGSLFTHLLKPDARHYLAEIQRVLKDGGQALISIHNEPAEGEVFSGNEARIDIENKYFLQMANKKVLSLKEDIGNVFGQQTFLLIKK